MITKQKNDNQNLNKYYKMDWFEELPKECPPEDAKSTEGKTFFRLISNETPNDNDFVSQSFEFPNKIFDMPLCILKSVSIFDSLDNCQKIKKYPRHRNKCIAKLALRENDGKIKKTFGENHYSWWRSINFSIDDVTIIN